MHTLIQSIFFIPWCIKFILEGIWYLEIKVASKITCLEFNLFIALGMLLDKCEKLSYFLIFTILVFVKIQILVQICF